MKNYYGLIGCYATNINEGISSFVIENDKLKKITLKASINNPTYLCNDNNLFSICSKNDMGGIGLINFSNLNNPILSKDLSIGKQPCYISIDSRRNRLFSSNYHTGEIKYYSYNNNSINLIDTLKGNENSKMHFVTPIPKTSNGIAIDLGNDEIIIFNYDYSINKDLSKSINLKKGCAPRHLVFHPSLKYIFVLTEGSSEIVLLEMDTNLSLKVISYTSTLPSDFIGTSFGGAIKISCDGKYIFTSNRGHNSISVFEFNEASKELKLINNYPTYGDHPRDFSLSKDDNYLVVANTFSNNLTLYKHDLCGNLTLLQKDITTNKPTCVLFL